MAKDSSGPGQASRKGRSASGRTTPKGGEAAEVEGAEAEGTEAAAAAARKPAKAGTGRSRVGRYTPATESGRYTAPVPRSVRSSPPWYGPLILVFLLAGLFMILLNYLGTLPASPTGWYLIGGLGLIFVGCIMATRYR